MMKIGIDGSRLSGDMSGIGRYISGLLKPLDAAMPEAQFIVYTKVAIALQLPTAKWQIRCETSRIRRRLPNVLWTRYRLGALAEQDQLDVFWAANTLVPRGLRGTPCVTTVYDLNHLLVPQSMSRINRQAHRLWLADDVCRAQATVAISHGTATRMRKALGRKADFVAQPGIPLADIATTQANADAALGELKVTAPYFLAVGTREPRKNLTAIIDAIARLKREDPRFMAHRLVLAGSRGWGDDPLSRSAPNWVQALGYVSDQQLAALYTSAAVFVFPSQYEGFGMPVSEALLFGCPVVATDTPELREAGSNDVVYVVAQPEAIADGIRAALDRPRPAACYPGHDWASSALQMRDALLHAMRREQRA
jgi:glycosyltransferase involved in cell wall biosynthesis